MAIILDSKTFVQQIEEKLAENFNKIKIHCYSNVMIPLLPLKPTTGQLEQYQ